jgi:hypothetical protein
VKPEQASKVEMRMPTRLQNGEGRTDGEEIDRSTRPIPRLYTKHDVMFIGDERVGDVPVKVLFCGSVLLQLSRL